MSKITYVSFVVDESGSMAPFTTKVPEMYNEIVNTLQRNARETGQVVEISLTRFNSYSNTTGFRSGVPSLTSYRPSGQTALLKALKDTMDQHEKHNGAVHFLLTDRAHLIIVLTDGEENASFGINRADVVDQLKRLQNTGHYTFAFNMPPGTAETFSRHYGIPRDNCREWEQTQKGFEETKMETMSSVATYMTERSKGATKSVDFYKVTTDLSNIKPEDLKQCDDMTTWFRTIPVPKETDIKSFVQQETGKPFLRGTAFYQLTKPEEIQGNKDVVIREKNGRRLYGGTNARKLIGLQAYKTGKIVPGNHSNYDIFVQSNSDNRKLVRGTSLLVVK